MEAPNFDYVEFYMTVSACEEKRDKVHINKHNSFVSVRVAELLSHAGFLNKNVQITATSCCSEKNLLNEKSDHKKHYLLIRTDKAVLKHFVTILNQGFSSILSDENNQGSFASKKSVFIVKR